MAARYQRDQSVTLTVVTPIELELGVVLRSGSYVGRLQQRGFPRTDRIDWTRPEYFIRLTGEQLIGIGMKYVRHDISMEYELTKFVSSETVVVEQQQAESDQVYAES